MRKIVVVLIICLAFTGGYLLNERYDTVYGGWAINWDLTVPKPVGVQTVFDHRVGFHGDGETYTILDFKEEDLTKLASDEEWLLIDEDSVVEVLRVILKFQENTVEDENSNVFTEYPVEYNHGDHFYFQENAENNYILAVMNKTTNKMYVVEWLQ